MRPRVAFVILNWNSREMTAECIRSLLAMNSQGYEIVVVDNGSHDDSVDYLRGEFPGIAIFPQVRNLGFAAGCNVGMRYALAEGFEYVLIINNDTVVDRHFLNALLSEAQKIPRAAVISPKIYFYDLPDRFWWAGGTFNLWVGIAKHVGRKQVDSGQYDAPRAIDWATGCAALIRCDALREVGLFEEILFGNGEDLDLSLRLRRAGYEIWFAPGAKLWHKEGVDYRKNVGEHARKFTGTRNLLWIMDRHASKTQWISFLPNFVFRYALFYVLLSLWRRDYRSAKAVLEGIAAYMWMRARPGSAPLPPALTARGDGDARLSTAEQSAVETE
jgi:GT2 family glycosyltransferase